jgi:two-component system, sensor histidine kinase PdtaS
VPEAPLMKKYLYLFLLMVFVLRPFSICAQTEFERGKALYNASEFDSAVVVFSELIRSCADQCNDTTLALYKTYLGKTQSVLEHYDKALTQFTEAIVLMDRSRNYNGKAFAMISLGEMYRKSYKLEKARNELNEVFDLKNTHGLSLNMEAYLYNRYAAVLNEISADSPLIPEYCKKVIAITNRTGDMDMQAGALNDLGYFEEKQNHHKEAAAYYRRAYEIYKANGSKIYIAQGLTNLARALVSLGKEKECEEYLKEGIALTENTTWYGTRANLLEFYAMFLKDRKRYEEFAQIIEKYNEAYKAKLQKEQSRVLLEMESKYESQKKSSQIESERQKSKLAVTEAKNKTLQRNYFALGGIVLTVLLFALYFSYKKIKTTNASLNVALLDREELLKEVNHRVKNNLQVVSSLLEMQADHTLDEPTKKQLLEGKSRINSISLVHELIYAQKDLSRLNISEYFSYLVSEIKDNLWKEVKADVEIECDEIDLPVASAIPLGILVNELLTNSFKHAQPANGKLEIFIGLKGYGDKIQLEYMDNGRVSAEPSTRKGMGSTIIEGMVRQLHATSEVLRTDGFHFKIKFTPVKNGKYSYS